jgi:hypothetical protein
MDGRTIRSNTMIILKAIALVLPAVVYLAIACLVWKGRLLGVIGRERFAAVATMMVATLCGVFIGGLIGTVVYKVGPGRDCYDLGCLGGLVFAVVGLALGLLAGVVSGWRLRLIAKTNALVYFAPPLIALLASIALVVFNSDMLR